ncbi:MAG: glycosyltransferase family 39 protein [Anaerolineae bacterium]|nr:glycosyltransferase family 39 protein [Anaerolineae bacterium]
MPRQHDHDSIASPLANKTNARRLWALIAVLLLAAALRAQDLHLMFDMAHYDEAYYGVDALSLVHQPRLTPFFPENFGRESLWMYLLAPSLAVFGANAFALRLVAFFTGVLTVAATYRLGRELFGWRAGIWGAAALAVLFWADVAGHQAFRAHLYPLIGALAFVALLRAWRRETRRRWIAAGVWLGLLAYTYIAARAWIAVGVLLLLWCWIDARRRRSTASGPLIALAVAAVIALPLIGYLLANPGLAGQRSEQVAIGSIGALIDNVALWARALIVHGSDDVAYTLPGRPILDLPLALLAALGVVWLVWSAIRSDRWRLAAILIALLTGASLAPALLTTDALKPLRAVGLIVPLALIVGLGAAWLETMLGGLRLPAQIRGTDAKNGVPTRRMGTDNSASAAGTNGISWRALALLLPVVLIGWAGMATSRDFATWVRSPDLFLPMEQHIYRGIDAIAAHAPPDAPVYFSPFTPAHPVLRLRLDALAPRPVSAFERADCLRLPDAAEAYYFALTMFDASFAQALSPWASVTATDWVAPDDEDRYAIYRAQPERTLFEQEMITFGERLAVSLSADPPAHVTPGETIPLDLLVRAQVPLDREYTLFAHLYGDPTPYEGGELWAQADVPLCPSSPPPTWRADEIIIQPAALAIPAEVPAGDYQIALGLYETASHERLGVSAPASGLDYAVVGTVHVGE